MGENDVFLACSETLVSLQKQNEQATDEAGAIFTHSLYNENCVILVKMFYKWL